MKGALKEGKFLFSEKDGFDVEKPYNSVFSVICKNCINGCCCKWSEWGCKTFDQEKCQSEPEKWSGSILWISMFWSLCLRNDVSFSQGRVMF